MSASGSGSGATSGFESGSGFRSGSGLGLNLHLDLDLELHLDLDLDLDLDLKLHPDLLLDVDLGLGLDPGHPKLPQIRSRDTVGALKALQMRSGIFSERRPGIQGVAQGGVASTAGRSGKTPEDRQRFPKTFGDGPRRPASPPGRDGERKN